MVAEITIFGLLEATLASGLGLVWGSFSATVALRLAQGERWTFARSRCDGCLQPLRPWQLVPLISYAAQRGRCRTCSEPIVPLHPLAEGAGLVAAVATILVVQGPQAWLFVGAAFIWLMVTCIDVITLRIPDVLSLTLGLLGTLNIALFGGSWSSALMAAATSVAILGLANWAFRQRAGKDGIGFGDFKLAAAGGLFLDPALAPWAIGAAATSCLVWAKARQAPARSDERLPFAPFLSAAFWLLTLQRASQM